MHNGTKNILKQVGLEKQVNLIEEGKCPTCCEIINQQDFEDIKSKKEFEISGMCQKCQDKVFG